MIFTKRLYKDLNKIAKKEVNYNKGIFFLSSEQERNLKIAPGDVLINKNNKKIICYKKGLNFSIGSIEKINIISISRNQMISLGTGLIPFLEHDDANRALMGSNMQRQALPLEKRETSIIETGTEKKIAKSSQLTKIAKKGGIIKFISSNKIIQEKIWKKWNYKSNYSILTKCKKRIKFNKLKKIKYKIVKYYLTTNRKSNQNNSITQTLTVKNNEWVKKGQTIVDGLGIKNGKLSLGKNIFIGYMSWEGYNFEDAIIINKRLIDEDVFTSVQMKKYKIFIINNEKDEVRIY